MPGVRYRIMAALPTPPPARRMLGFAIVSRRIQFWTRILILAACGLQGSVAARDAADPPEASAPLTLESALSLARTANARLPPAAADVASARKKEAEARADRWLKLSVEGDFIYAPRGSYDPILTNLGEERLQLVARQPVTEGGAHHAAIARSSAEVSAAMARYRIDEKDLELEVRSRFAEVLEADAELSVRREGIERLRRYRTSLESRKASGQGVAADLLKTDVKLATEEADLEEAQRRREESRLELNDLIGRDPSAPLALAAPAPADEPLGGTSPNEPDEPWSSAPEVLQAQAQALSASADLLSAKAERRPHLFVSADAGLWGSDTTRLIPPDLEASHPRAGFSDRLRRDSGYSLSLTLSWALWDPGAARARIAAAGLDLERARLEQTVQQRHARLEWAKARAEAENLGRQIGILRRAGPGTRDSFLDAESRYRGGVATSLEVLDAYAASVDASVRLADAEMRWRIARALELRWGTP
jgi:outer membrane protein TolC